MNNDPLCIDCKQAHATPELGSGPRCLRCHTDMRRAEDSALDEEALSWQAKGCCPDDWAVAEQHLVNWHGYPPSLAKAAYDSFDYALKLRDGTLIHFESVRVMGNGDCGWVRLNGAVLWTPTARGGHRLEADHDHDPPWPYSFPRGIDVRVADIVWCADAPHGS